MRTNSALDIEFWGEMLFSIISAGLKYEILQLTPRPGEFVSITWNKGPTTVFNRPPKKEGRGFSPVSDFRHEHSLKAHATLRSSNLALWSVTCRNVVHFSGCWPPHPEVFPCSLQTRIRIILFCTWSSPLGIYGSSQRDFSIPCSQVTWPIIR